MNKNAIVKAENQALVEAASHEGNFMVMISRALASPKLPTERVQMAVDMRNAELQRIEIRQFNEALYRVQTAMEPVARDLNNPHTKSRYASYYALYCMAQPHLRGEGFSISFNQGEAPNPGELRVLAELSRSGHSRHYHFDVPTPEKGAKDGSVMNPTQARVAAFSYGQRCLLRMILNIAIGSDQDASFVDPTASLINADQLDELLALAEEVNADKIAFCKMLGVTSFAAIPLKRLEEAKAQLRRKLKQRQPITPLEQRQTDANKAREKNRQWPPQDQN